MIPVNRGLVKEKLNKTKKNNVGDLNFYIKHNALLELVGFQE